MFSSPSSSSFSILHCYLNTHHINKLFQFILQTHLIVVCPVVAAAPQFVCVQPGHAVFGSRDSEFFPSTSKEAVHTCDNTEWSSHHWDLEGFHHYCGWRPYSHRENAGIRPRHLLGAAGRHRAAIPPSWWDIISWLSQQVCCICIYIYHDYDYLTWNTELYSFSSLHPFYLFGPQSKPNYCSLKNHIYPEI